MADLPNLSVVMLGGFLRNPSGAFVGPHAEQMMHSLHADHCFMSTVGLDADFGLTTLDIMEAQLNQRMIASAAQVTVLADSSKFGHRSLSLIADFQSVDRVITDASAPADQVKKLRAKNIMLRRKCPLFSHRSRRANRTSGPLFGYKGNFQVAWQSVESVPQKYLPLRTEHRE